ncbi:MAG TPA: sigma-70 family RNA polymerase sigma factor [Jatrophihabitans sp.]|uniref:RNA polymerase sigma factor n=1 Tax=Jatrophihabitans sp. TaxID=1932789 RepID=UPI002E05A4AA|nr:sigma-70 family RNA polymerase sigma factor [Jatrophihabitans sp.]
MTTSRPTDDDVVAAAAGDAGGLRAVWEGLAPRILGYLRAKGVADPEAVTSDVFLALLPKLPGVTGGAAGVRRLAFAIAHARMVDEHRARARGPLTVRYEPADDRRTSNSAEDDAEYSLAADRVRAVLQRLPDDQREVVTLRIVADLSIEQVAEIIGRSPGAVKQLQRRGMLAVRQAVTERPVTR